MDVNELSMRGDVDCKKPRLLHTSDSSTHNGHISTINLSYQIVLQDHNYGAPPPPPNNDNPYTVQCKQEPSDSHATSVGHQVVSNSQRGGAKQAAQRPANVSPQSARVTKPNGLNNSAVKRQRTTSGTVNGVGLAVNNTPSSPGVSRRPMQPLCETPKTQSHAVLTTPPLIPKAASAFPYGDLNSHLYASVTQDKTPIKEEPKPVPMPNGSSGLSGYLSGWYSGSGATKELIRQRSDMRNSINDDSDDGSLDNSPRVGTESDHEGEETETAPECEDEEDEQDDISVLGAARDLGTHEDSVTRCICKFGHDDGYMICCDRCSVWQHVDCMNLDRNNIPEEYMCELCQPRRVDRARARAIQHRKRQEFRLSTPPPSVSLDRGPVCRRERSKDRNRNDEYIDVEKTPKKFQRTYSAPHSGAKYGGRGGGAKSQERQDAKFHKAGKRAGQTKWKRRGSERQDDAVPRKRKMFRSKSETIDVGGPSSAGENSPPSNRNNASGELLLQWIDHYEEAVTNHYSPELRARVSAVRTNGLSGDLPSPLSSSPVYRLASKAGGYKTLVASNAIRCGSPIIECRGKYMLASQLRPYKSGDGTGLSSGAASGLRPTPHIIFHQLLTDSAGPNIDMCVDGRSYGNEARFVWQSCQPNAEIKHKIEKGSVHLYLVARTEILDSEEITVAHDTKNPLPCPYEGCPHMKTKDSGARTGLAPAQSGSPAVTSASAASTPASAVLSPVEADRKRRRRRTNSSMNDASSHQTIAAPTVASVGASEATGDSGQQQHQQQQQPPPPTPPTSSAPPPASAPVPSTPPTQPPTPVKRQHRTPSKVLAVAAPMHDVGDDSQDGNHGDEHDGGSGGAHDTHDNKKKLSREERKMEAIMKAFERMEKAQQRRQETQAKTTHRKDSRDGKDDHASDDLDHSPPPYERNPLSGDKRPLAGHERAKTLRKGKRGGRTRRISNSAGETRTRVRALSGEMNSGHSATEEESEHGGSSSSPGQSNAGPGDEPSSLSFKCPKTKKVVFNNWSGEGEVNGNKGDGADQLGGSSSAALSVPSCYMRNPNPRSPTRPFRTAHMRYGSSAPPPPQSNHQESKPPPLNGCRPSTLAALKSPAGSASPDPHGDGAHSNDENAWATPLPGCGGGGAGSAKKRWLRQAISEETETESPTGGNPNVAGLVALNPNEALDHVTPLKKRRLARASLSSETSFTPPSTPTPTAGAIVSGDGAPMDVGVPGSVAIDKEESTMESLSAENSQGTPPDDASVDAAEVPTNKLTNEDEPPSPPMPPTLELAKAMVDLSASFATTNNSNNSGEQSFSSMEDHLMATVALTQLHQDASFTSPSRPTWEFRAPDAQFMKSRAEAADPAAVAPAAHSPVDEKPKPAKRKLSILEYRQRKQTIPSDGMSAETPKDDSKTNGPTLAECDATTNKEATADLSAASDSITSSPIDGAEGSPTAV